MGLWPPCRACWRPEKAPATGLWIILDLSSTGADIGADTSAQTMPVSMFYTRYAKSSSLGPPGAGPCPTTMCSDAPDAARLAPHEPRPAAPCRTRMLTHQPARPAASPAPRAPAPPRAAPPPRRATRGKDPAAEANFLCSDDVRNSRTACIPTIPSIRMHEDARARHGTGRDHRGFSPGCHWGSRHTTDPRAPPLALCSQTNDCSHHDRPTDRYQHDRDRGHPGHQRERA